MKKRMRARNQHLKRLLSLLLTVVMVFAMIPTAFAADTASGFVIGPYLLAPKTTSMVAVWETSGSGEPTTIRFGTDANALGDAVTVERDPEAPAYGGVVGTTVTAVDKQQLAYSNISIQSGPVPCNSEIEISATITNTGKGMAAAVIPVDDNGAIKYIYGDLESDSGLSTSGEPVRVSSNGVKTLEPGESIELSGTVTLTEIGKHTVKVADASKDIEVQFRPATFSYTNVRTKLGNGEVSDINSDILNIKADITNIGNEAIESKQYALKAGEVKTCEFSVCIGDSAPETVYIEGSI